MKWLIATTFAFALTCSPAFAQTKAQLSWNASTDNVGVTGYNIYRDGAKVGTSPNTSYVDTGLTPDATYSYSITAVDAAGNESPKSTAITVKMLPQPVQGWPDETNTGVPAGTTLTNYTGPCTITAANTIIDAKIVNCSLRIQANGVQIKRSKVRGSIENDENENPAKTFTVTDTEIDANGEETALGGANFTATRVHVYNARRSGYCWKNVTIEDSYFHGNYTDTTGHAHQSGLRMSADCTFRHNTISCDAPDVPPDGGCSAGLTGYGDFAVVARNTIENNLFLRTNTGGYCAYGGDTNGKPYPNANNIKFIGNVWQRKANGTKMCGVWGPITSFNSNGSGNVWTNNKWDDGSNVPPAN
jgi:Fibronectin type III domain